MRNLRLLPGRGCTSVTEGDGDNPPVVATFTREQDAHLFIIAAATESVRASVEEDLEKGNLWA